MMLSSLASLLFFCLIDGTIAAPSSQSSDLFSILGPSESGLPSSGNSTSSPQDLYASRLDVKCFATPTPGAALRLRRIAVSDYFQAVQKIMVQDDAMISRLWNLGPDATVQYVEKGVRIGMNVPWPPSPRRLQPIYIAHAAAVIAEKCLREETGYLGGHVKSPLGNDDTVRIVLASPTRPSIKIPESELS